MNASRFLRKEERVLASIACRTELLSEVGSGAAVEAASAVRRMVDATGVIVASNSALSSAAYVISLLCHPSGAPEIYWLSYRPARAMVVLNSGNPGGWLMA